MIRFQVVGAGGAVDDLETLRAAWAKFVAAIDAATPDDEFPFTGAISGSSELSEAVTIHAADTREPAPAEAELPV